MTDLIRDLGATGAVLVVLVYGIRSMMTRVDRMVAAFEEMRDEFIQLRSRCRGDEEDAR